MLKETMNNEKEKVLFVDDEESILDIASEYFQRKGYQVVTAKKTAVSPILICLKWTASNSLNI